MRSRQNTVFGKYQNACSYSLKQGNSPTKGHCHERKNLPRTNLIVGEKSLHVTFVALGRAENLLGAVINLLLQCASREGVTLRQCWSECGQHAGGNVATASQRSDITRVRSRVQMQDADIFCASRADQIHRETAVQHCLILPLHLARIYGPLSMRVNRAHSSTCIARKASVGGGTVD